MLLSDTDKSSKIAKPSLSCWCGGQVEDSVHPFYSRCRDCKTFVLKQQLTSKQLKEFYGFDRYWHFQAVKVKKLPPIEQRVVNDFKDRIPLWFNLISQIVLKYKPAPNLLLEIGCAHGGFLHYCRQHGLKNVVGNEPDEETCRFAKEHFDLPYLVSGLFPDVSLPFDKFGAIVGFDVVEHFSKPVEALKKVSDLLSEKGFFLFQIPCYRDEGAEWPQFKPPEHIFLYDSQNIKLLFGSAGLEIAQILPGCFKHDMFVIGHKKVCET
jgi:SAM-dependent methyltransferase